MGKFTKCWNGGVARAGSGLNVGLSQSSGSSNGGVGVAGGGGEEEGRVSNF